MNIAFCTRSIVMSTTEYQWLVFLKNNTRTTFKICAFKYQNFLQQIWPYTIPPCSSFATIVIAIESKIGIIPKEIFQWHLIASMQICSTTQRAAHYWNAQIFIHNKSQTMPFKFLYGLFQLIIILSHIDKSCIRICQQQSLINSFCTINPPMSGSQRSQDPAPGFLLAALCLVVGFRFV
jgi:hypothetical protein